MRRHGILALVVVLAGVSLIAPSGWSESDLLKHPYKLQAHQLVVQANLRKLASSLEIHFSELGSYPANWLREMYDEPKQQGGFTYGPPEFAFDLQSSSSKAMQGYQYRYTPMPAGCEASKCSGYALTATPSGKPVFGVSVDRSFYIDQTGLLRSCLGAAGADATDPLVDEELINC
jgi:hypothetical protein